MIDSKVQGILPQLLLASRAVNQTALDEAIASAKRLDISLERALILLKHISEDALQAPLQASEMVRKGKLSLDIAIEALNLAKHNSSGFEEALEAMGAKASPTLYQMANIFTPFTELLLAAELVTPEQLGHAMQTKTNTPLGQALVINRYIARWALNEALLAQQLVKDEKISKEQAVNALRNACRRKVGVHQVLFELGQYSDTRGETLRLLELFAMSNILSESDIHDCLELEIAQDKPFGQAVLELKLVETSLLESACVLLDMVGNCLRPYQAAEALRQVRNKQVSVYQAIAELQPPPQLPPKTLRLGELIAAAGYAKTEQIEAVVAGPDDSSIRIGKRLLNAGLITETCLYSSLRCQSLYKEGILSADQTITVLSTCKKENILVEEALLKCGWYIPPRMHWNWT